MKANIFRSSKERRKVMKKIMIAIISIFLITPFCFSQTNKKELPISFLYNLQTNIEQYNLNVEFTKLRNESRIEIIEDDTLDVSDPIIGEQFYVSLNINNIGTWTEIANGDSIWQLQINANTDTYMMLIFNDFYLPFGTKLFVYSTDRSQILGPFTDENNYSSRKFTVSPLKTNALIMEYYKPHYIKEEATLNLNAVGLIGDSLEKGHPSGFGTSDSCMINAMCPEYENWCNQRRSVVLNIRVLPDTTIRWATSSLLTNEKQDGKPFLLTAFHVVDVNKNNTLEQTEIDALQNWLFIFNYQSQTCSNPSIEPTLACSISGATYLRGIDAYQGRDYTLLLLNQKPPKNYNAFYNGWTNYKDDMTETGVCIHHPCNDIKKIAEWKKISTLVNGWRVTYTHGGTQGGSSGTPLFNDSGYVVGQQCSGTPYSPCGKKSRGHYGSFHTSWHKFGLCYELNPNGVHSGSGEVWIRSMPGDETCKQNWNFNNCNDLHTSDNVSFLLLNSVNTRQYDGVYNAKDYISAENTTIQSGSDKAVVFEAGNKVVLKPGFHAVAGSKFTAKIGDCELGCGNGKNIGAGNEIVIYDSNNTQTIEKSMNTIIVEDYLNIEEFVIYPNPNHGFFSIKLPNNNSELQKIVITDARGIVVYNNNDKHIVTDNIQLSNPVPGMYIISLYFKDKILTSKFAVL
jgi:hypothetical protein